MLLLMIKLIIIIFVAAILYWLGRQLSFYFTRVPYIEKYWTTLFYGERGSGKSLENARLVLKILDYLKWLYKKNPILPRAIIYTNLILNEKLVAENPDYLYHWNYIRELRYCPRKNCWRGIRKHVLHGCYLLMDDIAAILPADKWAMLPLWVRKRFTHGRKFGIRILANAQEPLSIDINFRRYVKMAYKFSKIIGSKDPDETKPKVKRIWGFYRMRKIKAEWLWKFGDMTDEEIGLFKEKQKISKKMGGKDYFRGIWKSIFRSINRKTCEVYDTNQDVKEYKPSNFEHWEITCKDPDHPDCKFKKEYHSIT